MCEAMADDYMQNASIKQTAFLYSRGHQQEGLGLVLDPAGYFSRMN